MNGRLVGLAHNYTDLFRSILGYFRSLVFGNSLKKHNKLSSFSYSVVIVFLPFSHILPCYHTTKPPDVPCLFKPRAQPIRIAHAWKNYFNIRFTQNDLIVAQSALKCEAMKVLSLHLIHIEYCKSQ